MKPVPHRLRWLHQPKGASACGVMQVRPYVKVIDKIVVGEKAWNSVSPINIAFVSATVSANLGITFSVEKIFLIRLKSLKSNRLPIFYVGLDVLEVFSDFVERTLDNDAAQRREPSCV